MDVRVVYVEVIVESMDADKFSEEWILKNR